MVREQYVTSAPGPGPPRAGPDHVHKIGIYGWRKRCLYLFVLLLIVILVVNFALTIWILRVMWFNTDGMGLLQVNSEGVKLDEGESEFLFPVYADEIHSREVTALQNTGRPIDSIILICFCKGGFGSNVFSIISFTVSIKQTELKVYFLPFPLGPEGALFQHSVQVPLLKAEPLKDLRLEAPTRSLSMDAPKGVHLKAQAGNIEAASNMDVLLESTLGLLVLDAETVRMPRLPLSSGGVSGNAQGLFEVCVCPSGKLFLSKAGVTSTCSENQDC
uniref:Gamma-sarcoglycan n=1 Tax=Neogobius melanostomus TaxID=47308 RepID=A0A8C6U702_9GOBI